MRAHLTLLILVALSVGSFADQLREGARMKVKSNSIWFQELGKLTTWQRLKKAGNRQEFESYQAKELGARDAGDPDAVHRLRRLHWGGMLCNAVQLVAVVGSIPYINVTPT